MKNSRIPTPAIFTKHFISSPGLRVALVLALVALVSSLPFYSLAQGDAVPIKRSKAYTVVPNPALFILRAGSKGETVCRAGTLAEASLMKGNKISQGLHPINHLDNDKSNLGPEMHSTTGLKINLRGTTQLEQYPQAKQAFIAAALKWENLIKDDITINIDVDYGPKHFGEDFPDPTVIGSTLNQLYTGPYSDIRQRLNAQASSAEETALYSALPATNIPTDIGDTNTMILAGPILRKLGLLPAHADPGEINTDQIGFNSAFNFDFDPSNGVNGTDFDAVAVHEIGHVLGFLSNVGSRELDPSEPIVASVWDLFRFRPSAANLSNFSIAKRILSSGGTQVQFNGGAELGLSTANPLGDGGDENQASHWKADEQSGIYIGIMDPTIAANTPEVMTSNDQTAIDRFGYTLTPTAPPPNDNFVNTQVVTGNSGTVTGTNRFATKETGEPNHSPDNFPSGKSIWYRWTAPNNGTATMTTAGSDFDTLLAVYGGTSVGALGTAIAANDDENNPGGILTSRVQFNAVAGTTYQIAVDGYGGDQGTVTFNWSLPGGTPTPSPTPGGPNTVQFSASTASTSEVDNTTATAILTVTRTGTTTAAATVNYATTDATAKETSDYLAALGTLSFAANETSKTITVFILNDSYGENPETFNITLSSPVGCTLGSPAAAAVTINSDEAVSGTNLPNPVATASFSSDNFVRQHYTDFFNREADTGGLNFWKSQIDSCGTPECREIRKINVSAAFFVSGEFQQTGYLVYKTYQAAFNSGEFLKLRDFLPDTQEIGRGVIIGQPGAEAQLEANKVAFFNNFVQRSTFQAAANYPTSMTAAAFVDKLNANTFDPRNPGGGSLTQGERDALVALLTPNPSSATLRAQVLRSISENGTFSNRQFNKAFVLMQYFGYMRRNPNDPPEFGLDFAGYNFWLGKLNQFNGNYIAAEMVKAFITSGEYKVRFGPDQ